MQVVLRAYHPADDEAFIYDTWTKGAWVASGKQNDVKRKWFADKIKEIKKALERDKIYVACLKDDPYVIVGYIVIYNGNMEWIYTKRDYRNQGVDALLFSQLGRKEDASSENGSGRDEQIAGEVNRRWHPS